MPTIKLNATLQAYSRAPFHLDYVREAPKDDTQYVRKNGVWVNLDTSLLGESLDNFKDQVESLEKAFGNVNIYLDKDKEHLVYVNSEGIITRIKLPHSRVDNTTIGINGNKDLYVVDTPDGKTIDIVEEVYESLPEDVDVNRKVSGKLRAKALYVGKDDGNNDIYLSGISLQTQLNRLEKNMLDLETVVQGTGGFLDPYYFYNDGVYNKKAIPLLNLDENERNLILTSYAKNCLNGATPEPQTKIKDTYEGRIWVYSNGVWQDEGLDTVVNANNNGILGAVTGVAYNPDDTDTKFKVSIDTDASGKSLGTMSVNGLVEEFDKVVYREDMADPEIITGGSLVQRTSSGQIKAADPKEENDVVTLGWVDSIIASGEDIDTLYNDVFGE